MRHTRRELLAHIAQIQNQIGLALEYSMNDRDPNRAEMMAKALRRAHQLCIDASSTDRPVSDTEMRFLGFRLPQGPDHRDDSTQPPPVPTDKP